MTEDKRKKIITGCIIAGMVVLIIVLTTVILKVKKTKVRTADKTDPSEYSSSDITSKETENVTVPQEQPTEYSSSDITSKETERQRPYHYFSVMQKPIAGELLLSRARFLFGF